MGNQSWVVIIHLAWGRTTEDAIVDVSVEALPTVEDILSTELWISHGAHLGNRHPFVDLQGSPGATPTLQWNIWKALAPPQAKAAEPWRQRSMTSSWLLLNPCPRQVFFWEPVSNADPWCQGSCAIATRLSLLIKVWGQRRALGRERNEHLTFQEMRTQVGTLLLPCWVFW